MKFFSSLLLLLLLICKASIAGAQAALKAPEVKTGVRTLTTTKKHVVVARRTQHVKVVTHYATPAFRAQMRSFGATSAASTRATTKTTAMTVHPRYGGPPTTVVNSQDFGTVATGQPSVKTLSYALVGGGTTLNIAVTAGVNFSIQSSSCSSSVCTAQVAFTPRNPGLLMDAVSVTDSNNNLVYQTFVSGTGQGPQFGFFFGEDNGYYNFASYPTGVAVGPDGTYYVIDRSNGAVTRVVLGGNITSFQIANLCNASGIAVDGAGTLYVADPTFNEVVSYSTAGIQAVVQTTPLNGPSFLAVDGSGALYISDSGNGRIIKLDNRNVETTVLSGLDSPQGIAVDGSGNIFFSDQGDGGEVQEWTASTGQLTSVGNELGNVSSVALDAAGRVYFTTDEILGIINPATGEIYTVSADDNAPFAVAVAPNGDIFTSQSRDGYFKINDVSTGNFGLETQIQSTATGTLTIANNGNSALSLAGLSVGGPTFAIDSSSTCNAATSLAAATSCGVTVDFSPTAIDSSYQDSVTATSNSLSAAGSQNHFSLYGTGDGANTYTTLSVSPQSPALGASVSFTASVNAYNSGLPAPTGTVNFFDGESQLGSAPLNGSSAVFMTNSLSAGSHTVYATYTGDSYNGSNTSYMNGVTVGIGSTNANINITVSAANISLNQPETLSVTLTASGATPTGTVRFVDNGATLGTGTISGSNGNAVASFTTSSLSGGTHSLYVDYSGDQNYAEALSNMQSVTVAKGTSATTLTVTPSSPTTEDQVTLTANVTSGTNPAEGGLVLFSDQNGTIGYASVEDNDTGGTASITTNLSAGSHQIIANYTQDTNYSDSISPSVTVIASQGTPALGLNVSAASIKPGQTEILTMQLGHSDPFGETGTVTFSDQNGVLGSGTPCGCYMGNFSTLQLTTLTPGIHTITGAYSGDSNYGPSTSSPQTVTVSGATTSPTTTVLSVSSASITSGQTETLTANIQGGTASPETGSVTFSDQNGVLGSGTVAATSTGSTATLSLGTLSVGSHQITAVYSGDGNYTSSTSAQQTVTVTNGSVTTPTSTTLGLSSTSPALGSSETFSATVSASGNAPGGSVTFSDQNGAIVSANLVVGDSTSTASVTYTGLAFGSHQVTATYNGSSSYGSSTSAAQTVTVDPATTTTSLTVNPASAAAGTSVTLIGSVQSYTNPALNGVISFADQNGPLGFTNITPNSTGGSASLTLTSLSAGVHQITAAYNNDYEHAYSISPAQTVTITSTAAAVTTTTLNAPASATYRSPITFTISVSSANAANTSGQVILCDEAAIRCAPELNLAMAQVTSTGTAMVRFSPGTVGTHTYVAKFLGTKNFSASTSASQMVTVTGVYPSTTTISSTGAAGNYTLTGTVVGVGSNTIPPTGSVAFNDTSSTASPLLGSAALGAATVGFSAVQPTGSPITTGANPYAVATGDFNGDGFADVVLGNYNGASVSVLLGNGDGTFKPQVSYTAGSNPERVLVADFNGDGIADIVVANTGSNTVSILLGNGDGTFKPQLTYGAASPVGLGVMDLNHDGSADIVAGDYYSNTMSVLLGNGDGTFQTAVTYATGGTPQTVAEGDFNGDGNVDIAVGNLADNNVGIFLGNGDGTFQAQVTYAVGRAPQGVQVGDFNADGYDDLAVSNSTDNTISILLGNGDGTFKTQATYPVGADPVGLVIADFNGDGKQDLSVGNTAQSALTQSILLGNGDGTFQPQLTFPTGNFPYGEVAADFNGDGYPDLAISLFSSNGAAILLSQVTETASATLNNVSFSANSGAHNVDAAYPGSNSYSQSTSTTIALVGSSLAASTTQLTISPLTQAAGGPITFSTTVSGGTQTTLAPTGTVTLTNTAVSPAATLGTITLSNGLGSYNTSSLAAGSYSVVATYSGDSSYATSSSSVQTLVISAANGPVVNSKTFGSVPLAGTPATVILSYGASAGATGAIISLAQGTAFKAQPVTCANGVCSVSVAFAPTYPGLATDALTIMDSNGALLYKTFLYGTGTAPQLGYNLSYGVFGTYSGTVKSPASVAVGPDANLYVGDTATNLVYKVTAGSYGGGSALALRGLGKPAGIAVSGDGTVYIADQTNNVIRSFNTISSAQGTVTTSALATPTGVAIDGTGALYISDTGHGRIIKVDNQGAETTVATGLTSPGGLTLDAAGDLFYADPSSGGEITEIPVSGGAAVPIGQNLGALADIAVAPSGRIYFATTKSVSSILNGTVYSNGYFNLSGNAVNYGIALDRFQDVITTNTSGGIIAVTSRTGSSFTFGTPVGTTNTCCDSIENTGNSPLTVAGVVNNGANYALHTGGGECVAGQMLQPTQTCNVVVDFSPTAFQNYSDTVVVTSNSLNVSGSTNTSSLLETGQQIPTSTTVAVSPNPGRVGQPITFTATLAFTSTYATPPSGMMSFLNGDGSTLATVPVTGVTTQYTTSTLGSGTYIVTASYSGDAAFLTSVSGAQSYSVTALTLQTITFPAIPNHSTGDAPFNLAATASSGLPVSYTVTSGPARVSGSTATLTGSAGVVTIQATQTGNATYAAATPVSQSFNVTVAGVTLSGVSPATGALGGSATTVTLTGSNFNTGDLVQLNGSTISSTYVSTTTLTAVIPASFFAQAGTGLITVFDPSTRTASGSATFTVANTPQIVFTGPTTSTSGAQPTLTFQLVNPYPVALAGTLNLAFTPLPSAGINDPAVQFSTGGRSLPFNIPANSTATPTVQLQTGTVAGTATIALVVTANGVNVTPANVAPVVITIPAAAPTITSTQVTRNGNTLTVAVVGFSNTRETTQAVFHFHAIAGATIDNPDITLTVTPNFAAWYTTPQSNGYGSAFTYTQVFTLDQDAAIVQDVTVTLGNTVGVSAVATTP